MAEPALQVTGRVRTGMIVTEDVRNLFGDVCLDLDDRRNPVLRGASTVTLDAPRAFADDLTARTGRFNRVFTLDRLLETAFTQEAVAATANVWRLVGTFVMRKGDALPVAVMCDVRMRGDPPYEPIIVRLRITAQNQNIGRWKGDANEIIPVKLDTDVGYDSEFLTVSVQSRSTNGGDGADVTLSGLLRPSA